MYRIPGDCLHLNTVYIHIDIPLGVHHFSFFYVFACLLVPLRVSSVCEALLFNKHLKRLGRI